MKSILRATAALSASSIAGLLIQLAAVKVYAVVLGPKGWGFLGLTIGLLALVRLIASLGVGTALTRMGAQALGRNEMRRFAALCRAAWVLHMSFALVASAVVLACREPIARVMLGDELHSAAMFAIVAATFFALSSETQFSILNAMHRVDALAKLAVWNVALGTAATIIVVMTWGLAGVPAVLLAQSIVEWAVSRHYLKRETVGSSQPPTTTEVWQVGRELLAFALVCAASMLFGRGVELILPVLVLHELDQTSVGLYRAVTMISMTYLAFLIDAMRKDYYPRLARASTDSEALGLMVRQQTWIVTLIAIPVISIALAVSPYAVPLLFSDAFRSAVEVLQWHLVGDLFRFAGCTFGFLILARSAPRTILFSQVVGGGSLLLFSVFGMRWFGLAGLGVGYLAANVLYFVVVWWIVARQTQIKWTREMTVLVAVAAFAWVAFECLPRLGYPTWGTVLLVTLAIVASGNSLSALRRQLLQPSVELEKERETTAVS